MKTVLRVSLLVIGLSQAGLVAAQSQRFADPGGVSSVGGANGATGRRIGIRAELDGAYDSNVYGAKGALFTGPGTGRSKDDFRLTPNLRLDLLYPLGRQSLFLNGLIGYDFYATNTRLNRERIVLDGGANLRAGTACSATVDANYSRVRTQASDIFIISGDPLSLVDNVQERRGIGAQAQCGFIGLSPSLGYRHSETRNSRTIQKLNDSNSDTFDGSIGYQRPSLGRVSIYGSYTTSEYLNRSNDVKSYSAGGRFERNIGSRASGSVSLGYTWVDPQLGAPFRGTSYAGDLLLRPTEKLSLNLSASRSAELSNSVFAAYSITDRYALRGTYRLSRPLSVDFGASQQKRNYRQQVPVLVGPGFISDDEYLQAFGRVGYDFNRRLRFHAQITQERRKSDNALFNYSSTTVGAGVSLAFGG